MAYIADRQHKLPKKHVIGQGYPPSCNRPLSVLSLPNYELEHRQDKKQKYNKDLHYNKYY